MLNPLKFNKNNKETNDNYTSQKTFDDYTKINVQNKI